MPRTATVSKRTSARKSLSRTPRQSPRESSRTWGLHCFVYRLIDQPVRFRILLARHVDEMIFGEIREQCADLGDLRFERGLFYFPIPQYLLNDELRIHAHLYFPSPEAASF